MNELEATRVKLKCLEMVEGTNLDWWEVIRHKPTKERMNSALVAYYPEHIELAIGIVEGKPVWAGDRLYWKEVQKVIDHGHNLTLPEWSWKSPKPKTVMVELSESFVRNCANENCIFTELGTACRKALEE